MKRDIRLYAWERCTVNLAGELLELVPRDIISTDLETLIASVAPRGALRLEPMPEPVYTPTLWERIKAWFSG